MNWYIKAQIDNLSDVDFEEITKSPWQTIKSSFIDSVAYYDLPKIFEIKIRNGKKYTFRNVPKYIFENFMISDSKGKFFNRNIRNKYKMNRN